MDHELHDPFEPTHVSGAALPYAFTFWSTGTHTIPGGALIDIQEAPSTVFCLSVAVPDPEC